MLIYKGEKIRKKVKIIFVLTGVSVAIFILILKSYNFDLDSSKSDVTSIVFSDHLRATLPRLHQHERALVLEPRKTCCHNASSLFALLLVTSYYGNLETRSAMRRVFSTAQLEKLKIRRVFLLAIANDKYVSREMIKSEHERFDDLIQGNFSENYKNLTYKHLMGLQYAVDRCTCAKYVIKMDDDMVVNVNKLTHVIGNGFNNTNDKPFIAGYLMQNMKAIRQLRSKWYVGRSEYDIDRYPTFVSGWLYVTNVDTVRRLLEVSERVSYFWIDDLYVTGFLAQLVDVRFISLNRYFTTSTEKLLCCIENFKKYKYDCDFLVGPNGGDNNLFFQFNQLLKQCYRKELICVKETVENTICNDNKNDYNVKGEPEINKYKLF